MTSSVGGEALRRLDDLLAEHPNLEVVREEKSTTVRGSRESGFDVTMADWGREALIAGGGWHGHFDDPEKAAATFMWLLTRQTRIVVSFRGEDQASWKLQWNEDGKWMTGERGVSIAALFIWKKRREETLQNDLIGPRPLRVV